MTKKLLLFLMVAVAVMLSGTALLGEGLIRATPSPGWQCMPFAGVIEYTVDSCTNHAPVFVYMGDGVTALSYALVSVKTDADADCFAAHGGWSPVELSTGTRGGYGALTLYGEGLDVAMIPGTPGDQSCLVSRQPSVTVRVRRTRIDDDYLLLTFEPWPTDRLMGKKGGGR